MAEIRLPSVRTYDAAWSMAVALISSFVLFIITGLPNSVLAGYLTGMLYYYDKKQKSYHQNDGQNSITED